MLTSCLAACTHLSSTVSQLFEPKVQKIAVFTYRTKNRYFYHIFVSPGDAPGAITLNVVWMEREFDAYKLSRCMCPSKYNRLRYSEIFVKKIGILSYPLHSTPPLGGSRRNIGTPFGTGKQEWCRYPMVKNFEDIFIRFGATHERDGRTDRQTDTGCQHIPRLCICIAR